MAQSWRTRLPLFVAVILLLAELTLWIRSVWLDDAIRYQRGETTYVLQSVHGVVIVARVELGAGFTMNIQPGLNLAPGRQYMFSKLLFPDEPSISNRFGFGWLINPVFEQKMLMLPHWGLSTVLSVIVVRLGLPQWRAWRADERTRSGRCPICSYDLRATPDRCPECGREGKP